MAVDPRGRRATEARGTGTATPQNPRLWEMLVQQAKQKFPTYPSLPASKWVHNEYVKRGGIFVDSKKKDTRHDRRGQLTHDAKKEDDAKKKSKG